MLTCSVSQNSLLLNCYVIGTDDEELLGSCDDSTESGDCGYRNTGCGSDPFVVTLASDDLEGDDDDELNTTSVPLLNNRTSSTCKFYTCSSCLARSGFLLSARNQSETVAKSRKKREAKKGSWSMS